jgi:hypothetical protein
MKTNDTVDAVTLREWLDNHNTVFVLDEIEIPDRAKVVTVCAMGRTSLEPTGVLYHNLLTIHKT